MNYFLKPKPIVGFEQRYVLGQAGTVLNLATNKLLTPIKNSNGYYKVSLADGGGGHKQLSIHQLMAQHFLPNPYGHTQVNHINGNKADNRWFNLEWCSAKENTAHALKTGLRKGYMSADDKETYLAEVLTGRLIADIAVCIGRHPNSLSKMLRTTADSLHKRAEWDKVMKQNRKNTALQNLRIPSDKT